MSVMLVALTVLGLTQPQIAVNVDVSPGEVIGGVRDFHVKLGDTKGIVTQVEFYVNHDLRDTATSIPYNFKLDTINEDDGDLDIEFRAYTTEGENGKKALTIRVDNQVSKGPEFHTQKARDLVSDSKFDEAIIEGRLALKAKPGYNPARLVMALAYKGKAMYDRAQKYAQDALSSDPNFKDARLLLSSIDVDRAFNTFSRGNDQAGTLENIRAALSAAIDNIRKIQDDQLDSMNSSADNLLPYVDYALKIGRYGRAINVLTPEYRKNALDPKLANRLAYANLRAGRYQAALDALLQLRKGGKYDAYSYALEAVVDSAQGDEAAATEAIKQAVLTDADNFGVLTAQSFLALKKGNTSSMAMLVDRLNQKYSNRNEVKVYLSALFYRQGRYDDARNYFIDLIKLDPANADAYLQEGNMALLTLFYGKIGADERGRQVAEAATMFMAAVEARPESPEALTGLSIVALLNQNSKRAVDYGRAAVAASPTYPAGYYALSAALNLAAKQVQKGQTQLRSQDQSEQLYLESIKMVGQAAQIDKKRLDGASVPKIEQLWRYFAIEGKTPIMSAPE